MGSHARCFPLVVSEPGAPLASRAPRRLRVLVVDDDHDLRGALTDLLRFEGLEVDEAENGLEALLYLRSASPAPDAILLDLAMPVMTGWEFREAQLGDPAIAGIPVLILSARPAEGLSADAVLAKPCAPEVLLEELRRIAVRAA